jgi:hypothetical protein
MQRSEYVAAVRQHFQRRAPWLLERLADRGELDRFVSDTANTAIEWVSDVMLANPGMSERDAAMAVFDVVLDVKHYANQLARGSSVHVTRGKAP